MRESTHAEHTFDKTCRAFSDTISQKEVWRRALKATCTKHGLFEPSFPVESMTTDELRRSAIGPTRWYRKIGYLTDARLTLESRKDTLMQTNYCRAMCDAHPGQVHLVPGGRYVLTHADRPRIDLWDIGSPHMQPSEPLVLGTVRVDKKEIMGFISVSHPVIEGSQRLRFIARAQTVRPDMKLVHIFSLLLHHKY